MWSNFATTLSRRLWLLDNSRLCQEARSRTGLENFGEPPIEPGLKILTESLELEADLTPLGRFLMHVHLRDLLETRLRLAEVWRSEAEELDNTPIRKPIFIVGMPRSGSTFLHEMLAQVSEFRAPKVWEVMFPVGATQANGREHARRIRQAGACLWWFRRLAPEADAVYPMRAETPHECVAIHSYTLLSEEFVSTCRIPAYEEFLHQLDLAPVYAWQKKFLRHLQRGQAAKRWILNSPDHVYGLKELFRTFPDALIVQTHRNPVEVLKSSAQLTRVLRALYGRQTDLEEIQQREARVLADGTEKLIEFRDTHPDLAERFIDVKYRELVADPVGTTRRICEQSGTAFSKTTAEQVTSLALGRSRYHGPRASARPAEPEKVMRAEVNRFERYCSRFEVSLGQPEFRR